MVASMKTSKGAPAWFVFCSLTVEQKSSGSNGDPTQFPLLMYGWWGFASSTKSSPIVSRINLQPALKSAPKGIGAFEPDG
jgi:hypothetical protein